MTTTNESLGASAGPRMRLSGPPQLLQMVPYLVGFTPEQSVVLIGKQAPRGAVIVSARYDIDAPAEAARQWFAAASNAGADSFLVVLYDDTITGPPLPHREMLDELVALGAELKMEMTDALAVNESRWWSYICSSEMCCPSVGTPLVRDGEVAAEAVLNGLVARPSRTSLVLELEPDPSRVAEAEGLFERLSDDELLARALRPGVGSVRLRRVTALKRADTIERACVEEQRVPTPKEVIDLTLPMLDLMVRDCMMGSLPKKGSDTMLAFWRDVCRGSPEALVAGPATVFALCAYAAGDGARANVGIDRALAARPDYTMALLLLQAISGGMQPKDLVPDLVMKCEQVRAKVTRRGQRARRR